MIYRIIDNHDLLFEVASDSKQFLDADLFKLHKATPHDDLLEFNNKGLDLSSIVSPESAIYIKNIIMDRISKVVDNVDKYIFYITYNKGRVIFSQTLGLPKFILKITIDVECSKEDAVLIKMLLADF